MTSETRPHRIWAIAGVFAFAIGVAWRFYWIFFGHPAPNYIYSDMKMYVDQAMRMTDPNYQGIMADMYYPPGTSMFLAATYQMDGSWFFTMMAQFFLSAAIPLLAFGIAR
jgi:hypothetical protein